MRCCPGSSARGRARRGDTVEYVAHPPRAAAPGDASRTGDVDSAPHRRLGRAHAARGSGHRRTARISRRSRPAIDRADVVHVHSNGLLAELAVLLSRRRGKPVVLTLYGTEIWHYAPKRFGPDLFTRAYQAASAVTFYSERLLGRAGELGLDAAAHADVSIRRLARSSRGTTTMRRPRRASRSESRNRHLLVNVKRLHPLAGQRFLIEAMNEVIRTHPDTRLVICGTGALLAELPGRGTVRRRRTSRHVCRARG